MIGTITFQERGATPRGMARRLNRMKRAAALLMAEKFHTDLRDKRFTNEHAAEAGYASRKGEGMARGSKQYRRSYTGRKEARFGHTRPLEFTGESRRAARSARLSATATSRHTTAKASYGGLSKFNFRHPKSRINMALEFRRITAREGVALGRVYDAELDKQLKLDAGNESIKVF